MANASRQAGTGPNRDFFLKDVAAELGQHEVVGPRPCGVEGCGSRNGLFGDMAGLVGEDGVLPGGLHLLFGSHRGRFGWRPPRRS